MNYSPTQIENAIKQTILVSYINGAISSTPPDKMVKTLSKIFQRKQKVFSNLTKWVVTQIERGHSAEKAVQSLGFYGQVLADYADKNLNQPIDLPHE